MKKLKNLIIFAVAITMTITSLVVGASFSANFAEGDLITNGGPYTFDREYIATYMNYDYAHQTAFELQFKYDVIGYPTLPTVPTQPKEPDPVTMGFNDTFEFLVFDTEWNGWNITTVGPAGYDQRSDMIPEVGVVYTVTVPISVIESKLSTAGIPFGINLQTGSQLGNSQVTIVSLKYADTEYVQEPFTITGNWTGVLQAQ